MKRYIVGYWYCDRSRPESIAEIYKSGTKNGVMVSFWYSGKKDWQAKYKNDSLNGLNKEFYFIGKDIIFQNWKKNNRQGIQIRFIKTNNL